MLGLLALVGFFAIAAGVDKLPEYAAGFKQFGNNFAVPALFLHSFPSWFVGIAFAAIGIGALVPAAIMSIAAANLYTRNIHREFINQNPTDKQEAQMAKWVSLIVKFGALVFIIFVPTQYAIQLQLLGGIWIIQTLPAVMLGVYTRWFNDWALLVGWAVGTVAGTWMAVAANLTPTYPLAFGGYTFPGYTALYTVILNLVDRGRADAGVQRHERALGRRSTRPSRPTTTPEASEPRDARVQQCRTAAAHLGRAARDRVGHAGGIADLLGMGAERFADLAELDRRELGLEGAGGGRFAVGIDAQRRRLDRRPAGIVEHDGKDRQAVLLRGREHRARTAEIEAAVAGHLHHEPVRRRELGAERHAAGPAEAGAAGRHRRVRQPARNLHQHRRRVAHRLVEDDVLVVEHLGELRHQIMRIDGVGLALVRREPGGVGKRAPRAPP